ncbi:nuclease-related domain-containing protein [Aneurinibacillus tyrosinisolvens]|uniref:nuclease-related domain-containing protein n=1 Tax=Aneurinibacillus tyrosinisolvens TaxID=1443435 RepID=UPI00063F5A9F|nr:nuclease-related domain-containing protein [Aneurinibacillus tyrosinisolvens]
MATVREADSPLILESAKAEVSRKWREFTPFIFYGVAVIYFLVMRSFEGIAALIFLFGMLFQNKLWVQKRKREQLQSVAIKESESASILRDLPDDCFLINDAVIPLKNGQKTKIDHIVLTRAGIFVIESNNAVGQIEGSCDSVIQQWRQVIQTSTKEVKRPFNNPIAHITTSANRLQDYLVQKGIKNVPAIHSIVMFTNKSIDLKITKRGSVPVAIREEVNFHIRKMPAMYSDEQLNKVLPLLWDMPERKIVKKEEYVPLVDSVTLFGAYVYAATLFCLITLLVHFNVANAGYMDWGDIFNQTSASFLFSANIAVLSYAVKLFLTYKGKL